MDEKFIAKYVCAVDKRVSLWLKQCSMSNLLIDMDITLVKFSSLLSGFTTKQIHLCFSSKCYKSSVK